MLQVPLFDSMPVADFAAIMRHLSETGDHVFPVWQEPDSLAFVARGRAYRSEFHINPSHELMHSLKTGIDLGRRFGPTIRIVALWSVSRWEATARAPIQRNCVAI